MGDTLRYSKLHPPKVFMVWAVMPTDKETVGYDTVHSAVVVADTPEEAIEILTHTPRLEVPETSVPHPTKGWPMETMVYPLEFDPNATLKAVELDVSHKRLLHSHMHYG